MIWTSEVYNEYVELLFACLLLVHEERGQGMRERQNLAPFMSPPRLGHSFPIPNPVSFDVPATVKAHVGAAVFALVC